MARFWWEDAWAAIALAFDIFSLISTVMMPTTFVLANATERRKLAGWMGALSLTAVVWAARISILLSIVRVGSPTRMLRRIAFVIGVSFFITFLALEGQRFYVCLDIACRTFKSTAVAQLVTDVVADMCLVALPIRLLADAKLSRSGRILIQSAFSASLLITVVTVVHSVALLKDTSSGTFLLGNVRTAVSLVVCNLLVIVTFVYRVCYKGQRDLEEAAMEFTTRIYCDTTNSETGGFVEDSGSEQTKSIPNR
ncbi:hypothetical protein ID866_4625 [Astraeus odoratus]|nr:hypothetical protein ID866_4625 [Astraeus odoratus]